MIDDQEKQLSDVVQFKMFEAFIVIVIDIVKQRGINKLISF